MRKKYDRVILLVENELITIKALISKDLSDSYTSLDQYISVTNVLKEYDDMKEAIKNSKTTNK